MLDENQLAEIMKAKQFEREKARALKTEKVEKFEIIRAEIGEDTVVGVKGKKTKKAKGKAKAKSKGNKEAIESDDSL